MIRMQGGIRRPNFERLFIYLRRLGSPGVWVPPFINGESPPCPASSAPEIHVLKLGGVSFLVGGGTALFY